MRRLALLLFAGLMASSAASRAQPLPPDPDPAAVEVARIMIASIPRPRVHVSSDAEEERRIEESLLSALAPERPCDRNNGECRAAAQAIARQFAPAVTRRDRELGERMMAYALMDALRPDQLGRLAATLRTEDGRLFIQAWNSLWTGRAPQRQDEIDCRARERLPNPYAEARILFRQRTAHLPRTREAPPVMVPLIVPPMSTSSCSRGEAQ